MRRTIESTPILGPDKERKEKKEFNPLSEEELKELRELSGPPWEDIKGRIEFANKLEKLGDKEKEEYLKRISELNDRRVAEIIKYEGWLCLDDKLRDMINNPEEYNQKEKAIKAEGDKLTNKEKENLKERLRKLRLYLYPEVWGEKEK